MEAHKDFPSFWVAVLLLGLLFGLQIILNIVVYDLGFVYEAGDPGAAGLIMVLSCGILFSILMSYKKINYRDIFNPTSNSVISIIVILTPPILLVVGSGVFWISDITNLIMLYFPITENEYLMFSRLLGGGVVSVIVVCVVAPFIEEMLFRGVILRSFLVNYSVNSSIVLSSLLFALYHLNIYQIPVAFIIGCLFGWLYVRTRTLWPSIIGHALYNACAILLSSANASSEGGSQLVVEFNSLGVTVASIMVSIFGVVMLASILKPADKVC